MSRMLRVEISPFGGTLHPINFQIKGNKPKKPKGYALHSTDLESVTGSPVISDMNVQCVTRGVIGREFVTPKVKDRKKGTTSEATLVTEQATATPTMPQTIPQPTRTTREEDECRSSEAGFGVLTHVSPDSDEREASQKQECSEKSGQVNFGVLTQHLFPTILPTPIAVPNLSTLLAGYDNIKKKILIDGLSRGFVIPSTIATNPPKFGYTNHKTVTENRELVQSKIDRELSLGRISGPFDNAPCEGFIVSVEARN